jgi:hypothetical protein
MDAGWNVGELLSGSNFRPELALAVLFMGGVLLAIATWGHLYAPAGGFEVSRRRAGRLFLVLLALLGYLFWERQTALDEACGALSRAFTWTADPPHWDNRMSLNAIQTQNLSQRLPDLKTALRTCS